MTNCKLENELSSFLTKLLLVIAFYHSNRNPKTLDNFSLYRYTTFYFHIHQDAQLGYFYYLVITNKHSDENFYTSFYIDIFKFRLMYI